VKQIKSAVLGCTGLVGQQFIRMLDKHPFFNVAAVYASDVSAGRKYEDVVKWRVPGVAPEYVRKMIVEKLNLDSILNAGIKIVFSALPADVAGEIESQLRANNRYVFSNASAHRMNEDIPILIPEVNRDHLNLVSRQASRFGGFIVTNSNCSTAGLALALKPILRYGIKLVTVATYQAISGAGLNGLTAMDISGNIIPYIGGEEEKMETELQKILSEYDGKNLERFDVPMTVSCCRVPVRVGHLESVAVHLRDKVEIQELINTWSTFQGLPQKLGLPSAPEYPLLVSEETDRPQPGLDCYAGCPERARGMTVTIGRIRQKGNILVFVLLVNNIIRGAAGTSILNAELAVREKLISGTDIEADAMKQGGVD